MAHSDGECNAFVGWTVFLSLKKRLLIGNKAIKRQNIIGLNVFTLINKLRYAQLIIEIWTLLVGQNIENWSQF